MSLWIETPAVLDKTTGETLLKFKDSNWSLDAARWLSDSIVELTLRKYPGNHLPVNVIVTLDCANRTASIGEKEVLLLVDVESALESVWNATSVSDSRASSVNSPNLPSEVCISRCGRNFGRVPSFTKSLQLGHSCMASRSSVSPPTSPNGSTSDSNANSSWTTASPISFLSCNSAVTPIRIASTVPAASSVGPTKVPQSARPKRFRLSTFLCARSTSWTPVKKRRSANDSRANA